MSARSALLTLVTVGLSWSPLAAGEPDWLTQRCRRLLEAQHAVQQDLKRLSQAVEGRADKQPRPEDRQALMALAEKLKANAMEVTRLIHKLEAEEPAVAFPEVFRQVRADLRNVQRRLERGDVGRATLELSQDVLATFDEMLKALRKK
jgi:hypothetical protein